MCNYFEIRTEKNEKRKINNKQQFDEYGQWAMNNNFERQATSLLALMYFEGGPK